MKTTLSVLWLFFKDGMSVYFTRRSKLVSCQSLARSDYFCLCFSPTNLIKDLTELDSGLKSLLQPLAEYALE